MTLTFIVGTGRCGSTLLSTILHTHPAISSLSEFFATVRLRAFPPRPINGLQFWQLLARPDPNLDGMVGSGLRVPEHLYPYGSGRFRPQTGVPAICHMTLPMLTDDPDALHDELAGEVRRWPRRPVAEHYRQLFAWMRDRFGRSVTVERSGLSLPLVGQLRATFPEARFVHMYRDGPDCALSMSRHAGFRMIMLAIEAARLAGAPPKEFNGEYIPLPPRQLRLLPPDFARMFMGQLDPDFIMGTDLSLPEFGRLWSSLIQQGVESLSHVPPRSRMSLRYETLLADPVPQLTMLAEFIGVEAEQSWLDEACRRLDLSRAGSATRLDPAVLADLRTACSPGEQALSAAAAPRLVPVSPSPGA